MEQVTRRNVMRVAAVAGVTAMVGTVANADDKKVNDDNLEPRDAGFRFRAEGPKLSAMTGSLGLATVAPVIYAGTAGGGPGEYASSSNPNIPNRHTINMAVPAGKSIVAAWYVLTHNIAAVSGFALINVAPQGQQVELQVGAFPGQNARLRITIYALFQ